MILTETDLINNYQLLPHPEGGYYKETYRAAEAIQKDYLPLRYQGDRLFSTAIYYLLGSGDFSAFHRIKSDETWHFYAGVALNIYVLHPKGRFELVTMGGRPDLGQLFQATIKAGHWFAAQPTDPEGFSFLGCTVAPGFDFDDFELANAEELLALYPEQEVLIRQFCKQEQDV